MSEDVQIIPRGKCGSCCENGIPVVEEGDSTGTCIRCLLTERNEAVARANAAEADAAKWRNTVVELRKVIEPFGLAWLGRRSFNFTDAEFRAAADEVQPVIYDSNPDTPSDDGTDV